MGSLIFLDRAFRIGFTTKLLHTKSLIGDHKGSHVSMDMIQNHSRPTDTACILFQDGTKTRLNWNEMKRPYNFKSLRSKERKKEKKAAFENCPSAHNLRSHGRAWTSENFVMFHWVPNVSLSHSLHVLWRCDRKRNCFSAFESPARAHATNVFVCIHEIWRHPTRSGLAGVSGRCTKQKDDVRRTCGAAFFFTPWTSSLCTTPGRHDAVPYHNWCPHCLKRWTQLRKILQGPRCLHDVRINFKVEVTFEFFNFLLS